ncbi:unnamed protein product [Rangifer tarandus platyrhynchus]|uniref:Uncharacterized protein n=3 Tax=Rangifer tarandus platyrhynchus TaxID=3082113 RepID=A0AC59YL82_RANTA|nr:unnamed protein product [Rangifer tarandus platyrhynchus]
METKRYILMLYLGYDQSLGHLIINLRTVQLLQVGVTKIVIPHDEKTQQELCCYNHHMNLEIKPLTICQRLQFGSSPVSMEGRGNQICHVLHRVHSVTLQRKRKK